MGTGRHSLAKRVLLVVVCIGVAPALGVWAGGSMPNPPGNGPGAGQVVVGIAVPAVLTFLTTAAASIRSGETVGWAIAALAATGGLVLFLAWFVRTYLPT